MTAAHTRTTDSIDAVRGDEVTDDTRSRAGRIRVIVDDAADHVPKVLESAWTGVERIAGRLPDAAERTQLGVGETTTTLQALPDPTLRLLAAASIGLATGLYLAGVPRLITLAALAPALLAGGAMATRPAFGSDGIRH